VKVLYVEDDRRDADLARRELAGCTPWIALDVAATLGEARARLADEGAYDLVLADLRLPDGLGLDLLAEIRERGLPLAVVILTGQGDEATAVGALKAGADDYVPKREGYLARLPAALEAALARRRAEAARRAGLIRVLCVEHSAADIDLTARHLAATAPHIRIETAHSAEEALARLPRAAGEACPWDVLLLDYRLPGLSALELLKALRDERAVDLPVVLVTGQGDEEVAVQALRLGAADYVVKHPNYLYPLPAVLENAHHRNRLAREQAALRASESRLRLALEAAEMGTVEFDLVTGRGVWSDDVFELLGYPPDAIEAGIGALRSRSHPDDVGHVTQAREAARRERSVFASEFRILRADDGRERWLSERGRFTYDDAGEAVRLSGVLFDITERKNVEAVLAEAQQRLRRAVSAGNVGPWDWDLRTGKVFYSPEWKSQIGYADDEVSSDFEEWRGRVHPEDLDRALKRVEAYLGGSESVYEVEFRLRHKNGSYRHILARGSMVLGGDGSPIRPLGSHVDITERTELQAQFLQAQKMESVGRLAGGVAHDFDNLLTVINGTADLAAMKLKERDPLAADLRQIRRAGDRAAALTRQLLAFSRRQIMAPHVLNLNTVLAEMQGMLRRLIGEHIKLVIAPAMKLGSVMADPGQIEQVVLNLAVNAQDAMPDGGTLTFETADVDLDETHAASHTGGRPGPHVMLAVSDTGVGMDEATRARVFEPFFTTKAPGKGTGLGLSTVYGIVKQSGGSIWVYSEPGRGTRFKIYLPRVAMDPARERPVRATTAIRGTETILLVEDEESLRDLARRLLESAGYTVLPARNGEEALLLLERREQPVHLVFTDVVMPGMSGRDLAGRLREIRPGIKILFTSGYTDDYIVRRGVLDDATHFLGELYTFGDLTRKVREVLDS
jgi:PAS domain S-box-containing protein